MGYKAGELTNLLGGPAASAPSAVSSLFGAPKTVKDKKTGKLTKVEKKKHVKPPKAEDRKVLEAKTKALNKEKYKAVKQLAKGNESLERAAAVSARLLNLKKKKKRDKKSKTDETTAEDDNQTEQDEVEPMEFDADAALDNMDAAVDSDDEAIMKHGGIKGPKEHAHKKETEQERQEKLKRTIFIGNVPLSCNRKKLLNFVSKLGVEAETCRFRNVPVEMIFAKNQCKNGANQKKYNGVTEEQNAYLVLKNDANAQSLAKKVKHAVAEINGKKMGDNTLRTDFCADPLTGAAITNAKFDRKRSVFVGGLPVKISEEELREFFADAGEVKSVRIVRDKLTKFSKGFGYVLFANRGDVKTALKKNNALLSKRNIRVQKVFKEDEYNKYQEWSKQAADQFAERDLKKKQREKLRLDKKVKKGKITKQHAKAVMKPKYHSSKNRKPQAVPGQ